MLSDCFGSVRIPSPVLYTGTRFRVGAAAVNMFIYTVAHMYRVLLCVLASSYFLLIPFILSEIVVLAIMWNCTHGGFFQAILGNS